MKLDMQLIADLTHTAAAQKQLLSAKLEEFSAYAQMRNMSAMNLVRDQAHTLLDAYCDTVDRSMAEIRKADLA
ncbi:hypothetical protein [Sphingobium yanoikuyae]|uniref:Uncharacterized protein n=1 Tax=Sphingobium yanoikuyae TaxID=13690 RepID=A0A291N6A2_SPHYA|nr:hypothetical protein [Sphingobium yanoikuyae]ATI82889.1 hypothetical protein A6768_24735 [Sphingobium yanoikuyae]